MDGENNLNTIQMLSRENCHNAFTLGYNLLHYGHPHHRRLVIYVTLIMRGLWAWPTSVGAFWEIIWVTEQEIDGTATSLAGKRLDRVVEAR